MSESIANRLGKLEHQLNWLMSNMRMKGAIQTGVLGANGQPAIKTFEGSMLEMYAMAQNMTTIRTDESDLAGLEQANG